MNLFDYAERQKHIQPPVGVIRVWSDGDRHLFIKQDDARPGCFFARRVYLDDGLVEGFRRPVIASYLSKSITASWDDIDADKLRSAPFHDTNDVTIWDSIGVT